MGRRIVIKDLQTQAPKGVKGGAAASKKKSAKAANLQIEIGVRDGK